MRPSVPVSKLTIFILIILLLAVKAMKRIEEIKSKRQNQFIKNRYKITSGLLLISRC